MYVCIYIYIYIYIYIRGCRSEGEDLVGVAAEMIACCSIISCRAISYITLSYDIM